MTWWIKGLGPAAALAVASSARCALADAHGDHHHTWEDMAGWGMAGGPTIMIFVLAASIILVVFAIRRLDGGRGREAKTPLDILEERFARGETDGDEFEEKRRSPSR